MAENTGEECPSCGRIGTFIGPEPPICVMCNYVLTEGSIAGPPADEPETDPDDEWAGEEEDSDNG